MHTVYSDNVTVFLFSVFDLSSFPRLCWLHIQVSIHDAIFQFSADCAVTILSSSFCDYFRAGMIGVP